MRYIFIPIILICISVNGQKNIYLTDSSSKINYDSIKFVLEQMYYIDQGLREILEDSIGYDSHPKLFLSRMYTIDRINQNDIEILLNKYGWLPKSRIGQKASEGLYYVIQHSNLDLIEKYFPQLDRLAKIGEANKFDAATMEDRLLKWKGKKQKYGTQSDFINGRQAIWPIEFPDKVDSLRKTVGFKLTVNENAKRLNSVYNPNEKLPEK